MSREKIGEKHIIKFDEKIYNESINEQCKDIKVDRFELILNRMKKANRKMVLDPICEMIFSGESILPVSKFSETPKPKHKY